MSPIHLLRSLPSRCRSSILSRKVRVGLCSLLMCLLAGAWPTVVQAEASDDAYQLAAGFYKKERWDLAADAFQKFIKQYPNSPRVATARFFLGLAHVNTGDYKAARDTLRIFLQEAPMSRNVGHAIYRIAESSYLLDDFARAEPELTTFITKYPEDPLVERALPYLADVQLRLNKPDVALKTFQEALKKFPAGAMAEDCEFGIAKCYEVQKQYQPAVDIYTRLAARTDSERAPEAQLNLGNRLYDLDQFDKAAAAFAKLEQAFPNSPLIPIARLNHGFSLFEVNQYEQAAEQFAIAEKDPKQVVEAGYWRGRCLSGLGKYPDAVTLFKDLYARHEAHPLAENILFQLADAEQHLGNQAAAQKLFLEFLKRFPKSERADDALHLATLAAFESGEIDAAEKLLGQFNQSFADSPLKWQQELLSGRLQLMKNQTAAALPFFDRVLKGDANETTKNWARYYTGFALLELGQPVEALAATETLAQHVDTEPQAQTFAGVFLLRGAAQLSLANKETVVNAQKELYGAAMTSASQFLTKAPMAKEADQALAVRALAAAHSGLKDKAKADVETLQKNFPESPELDKCLYEVAEVAYSNDDWEWSGQLFGTLAAKGKTSKFFVPGLSGQAWSLYQTKQYPAAGKLFGQIATDFPDHKDAAEAAFMQGKAFQNDAQPAEAIPVFEAALQKFSTSKFGYLAGLEAARLRRDAMQYPEADKAYAAVLEKFPKPDHLDKILNEWALSNYEGKDYARSDEVFARLIKEVPDSDLADNAGLSLAESDLVSGKLDAAREKFQALEKNPKADEVVQQTSLYQLIGIAVEKQDWADVRAQAEALTTRFPESKYRWFAEMHWAEADLNLKENTKAIERLKTVVAQKDNAMVSKEAWFGQAWVLLAEAHNREQQYDEVAATVTACREWKPDLPVLYILDEIAGRSLKAQAKFPEAIATFQRIVEDPNGRRTETAAKAQFMIGEIFLLQKEYAKAEAEFLKVEILYKFPEWQAPALFQAGSCQEELQHWKDAAKSYESLIKDYPKSDYAKMAAERLPKVKAKVK